ncbi:hypothetical protein PACTADRAFT_84812 [Pachysolen tannophilus NRRL Y-2460]|uniref:Myb-like domain-containing protein n=1 Tax=Pachysolen tannophilus NRRL Y-2460 TaxID=669874 RepID=A0A1E4TW43_PACTA|nr:hypothetical protein PACTADRAFT_84812 [Pachysolen tannophilus NRRL Y-2460]
MTYYNSPSNGRASLNENIQRQRRLSSITSGLGSGGLLRRASLTAKKLTNLPPTNGSNNDATLAVDENLKVAVDEPVKIGIPITAPARARNRNRVVGKLSKRKYTTRKSKEKEEGQTLGKAAATVVAPAVGAGTESEDDSSSNIPKKRKTKAHNKMKIKNNHNEEEDGDDAYVTADSSAEPEEDIAVVREGGTSIIDSTGKVHVTNVDVGGEQEFKYILDRQLNVVRKVPLDEYTPSNELFVINNLSQIPKAFFRNDTNVLEDFKIDEDSITMTELCRQTLPLGVVSENFELVKEAAKKRKDRQDARRKQRQKARLERRPIKDYDEELEEAQQLKEDRRRIEREDGQNERAISKTTNSAIQLKVGTTGELAVDDESLYVNRHERDSNNNNRVKENANIFENPITSATYGKNRFTDRWTSQELAGFYKALSSWGTDFNIIAQLFPHRTRRQIKSKFSTEEKKHPHIVELALSRKLPVNFGDYCKETGQSFKTLAEYDHELKELKEKHERELKEMQEAYQKQKQEDAELLRKKDWEARTGVKPMTRDEKLAELRRNETVIGTVDSNTKREQQVFE